jgi:hypothetical protein
MPKETSLQFFESHTIEVVTSQPNISTAYGGPINFYKNLTDEDIKNYWIKNIQWTSEADGSLLPIRLRQVNGKSRTIGQLGFGSVFDKSIDIKTDDQSQSDTQAVIKYVVVAMPNSRIQGLSLINERFELIAQVGNRPVESSTVCYYVLKPIERLLDILIEDSHKTITIVTHTCKKLTS